MKVSHVSDIHLEWMNFPDFSKEEGGDVLILNGDILVAAYLEPQRTDKEALRVQEYLREHFIPELMEKFNHVLYLAGNHEFYRSDINTGRDIIKTWFYKNTYQPIFFMENDVLDVENVRFIGSTLWSDFLGGNQIAMFDAWRGMNDFRIIRDGKHSNGRDRLFTPEKALVLHNESVSYIWDMSNVHMPVVVLTHHAPHASMLNPHHSGSMLDGAYYTDLTWIMEERRNIKYWVSGHTHGILENKVADTICVSNCRGYYTEPGFKNWTGLKHFEV